MNFLFKKVDGTVPILFLHGWGGDIRSFLEISKQFDRSVILVDFPGHGKSAEPDTPLSVMDFTVLVVELLKSIKIEQVDVVSHSFGGRVSIKLAAFFPEIVRKLILCSSAGILPKRRFLTKIRVFQYKIAKFLVKLKILPERSLHKFGSEDFRKLSPVMKQSFVKIVSEDLSSDAQLIMCPTLLVWGENDTETPIFMAKKLGQLIKDSGLVVFENSGHFVFIQQFARFVLILKEFLR